MLRGGDELGQTQSGNNNAYCQDNPTSWIDWDLNPEQKSLLEFVRQVVRIRHRQPVLQRRTFFQGRSIRGKEVKDITFFDPSGKEMTDQAWTAGFVRCLGIRLAGDMIEEKDERGNRIVGDTLLLLFNGHHETVQFTFPAVPSDCSWQLLVDTSEPALQPHVIRRGVRFENKARSTALFRVGKDSEWLEDQKANA